MPGRPHEDVDQDGEERGVDAHDGLGGGQQRVRHAWEIKLSQTCVT